MTGKGEGRGFDRLGYRQAVDNLSDQAPSSGMPGFLALARQESLPSVGASWLITRVAFLSHFRDGQLPVSSPESSVLLPLRGRRHRQLPPRPD